MSLDFCAGYIVDRYVCKVVAVVLLMGLGQLSLIYIQEKVYSRICYKPLPSYVGGRHTKMCTAIPVDETGSHMAYLIKNLAPHWCKELRDLRVFLWRKQQRMHLFAMFTSAVLEGLGCFERFIRCISAQCLNATPLRD